MCSLNMFFWERNPYAFSGIWEEGLQSALMFMERNREKEDKLLVRRNVSRKM